MSDQPQNVQQEGQPEIDSPTDAPISENENLTSDADGVGVGHSVEGEYDLDEPIFGVESDAPDALDEIALREEEAESQGEAVSDAFFEEDQPMAADIPGEGVHMVDDGAINFMAERAEGIDETDVEYIAANAAEQAVADSMAEQGTALPDDTEIRVDVLTADDDLLMDEPPVDFVAELAAEGTVDTVLGVAADEETLADVAPGGLDDAIADAVADMQTYTAADNRTLDEADEALDVAIEDEAGEATSIDDDVMSNMDAALADLPSSESPTDPSFTSVEQAGVNSVDTTSVDTTSVSASSVDTGSADEAESTLLGAVTGALSSMASGATEAASHVLDNAAHAAGDVADNVSHLAADAAASVATNAVKTAQNVVRAASERVESALAAGGEQVDNTREAVQGAAENTADAVATTADNVVDTTTSVAQDAVEAGQNVAQAASERVEAIAENAQQDGQSDKAQSGDESVANAEAAAEASSEQPTEQAIATPTPAAEFAASDSESPNETMQAEVEPEPVADMVAQAGVVAQGDEAVMDEVVAEGMADDTPPASIPAEDMPAENIEETLDEDGERQVVRTLTVGEQVMGTVKRLTDFGAFVDIGVGRDGLIHISELALGRVDKVSDVLTKGQEVTMWIKKLDRKRNRISLTMVDPDRKTIRDLKEDEVVEGTVTRILPYGAFIDIGVGRDALLHVREMSNRYVEKPEDVVSMGETLEARIISLSRRRKRVDLSLKGLRDEPELEAWEAPAARTPQTRAEPEPEVPQPEEIDVLSPMELAFKRAMEADGDDVDVPDKQLSKGKRRRGKQSRAIQDEIVARTLEGREQG